MYVAAESCSVTVRLALEEFRNLTVTEDLSDCVTEAVKSRISYARVFQSLQGCLPFGLNGDAIPVDPCWAAMTCKQIILALYVCPGAGMAGLSRHCRV